MKNEWYPANGLNAIKPNTVSTTGSRPGEIPGMALKWDAHIESLCEQIRKVGFAVQGLVNNV